MIIQRPIDCGALYEAERQSLLEVLRTSTDRLRTPVPATPAWTVQDVLAHVVGITADLNAGDFGGGDPDAWTARQVACRAGRTLEEIAQEWDAEAPAFEEGLRLFGYEMGSHFVGDLVQHVADVHHALGLARRPDDDTAVVVALDFYLDSFHQSLRESGIGVTAIIDGERWDVGAGAPIATVAAGRVELLRCLGGRRSAGQIRALDWQGDAEMVIPLVSRYGLPDTDLEER